MVNLDRLKAAKRQFEEDLARLRTREVLEGRDRSNFTEAEWAILTDHQTPKLIRDVVYYSTPPYNTETDDLGKVLGQLSLHAKAMQAKVPHLFDQILEALGAID